MTESQVLLADYVRSGSESAFRELLTRYLDLVYSTAVRLVDGDTHRAKDVAQVVFSDLARMAGKLSGNTMLGGWLHRHTCFVARTVMRGERRRQFRERKAVEMHLLDAEAENVFAQIAPTLDEAILELGPDDRNAILLRFYERRNLRSVGEALGISENVAQKRVARAVEELGALLKQRGVTLSATALAGGLTVGTVTAAPAGLAIAIAGNILPGTGAAGGFATTSAKAAAATKFKVGIVAAMLIVWVASVVFLQTQFGGRSSQGPPSSLPPVEPPRAEIVNRSEPTARNFARAPRQDQFADLRKPDVETPPVTQPDPSPVAVLITNSTRRAPARLPPQMLLAKATRLDARSDSKVIIEGTSNLHDWLVESPLILGFLEVGPNFPLEPGQAVKPEEVEASGEAAITVRQLRSINSDGTYYSDSMDMKMRDMLRLSEFPKIVYQLTELVLKAAPKSKDDPYLFDSKGELAVAGKTNTISMLVKVLPLGKRNGDQRVKITGRTALKITDYGISPNSIIISKIGDEVTIHFQWILGRKTAAHQ